MRQVKIFEYERNNLTNKVEKVFVGNGLFREWTEGIIETADGTLLKISANLIEFED